ncbi:PEPxxWA-CTERM sorting domain-containing protein [Sphingomonas sp. RS2018]
MRYAIGFALAAVASTGASAQVTNNAYGSASLQTVRNCPTDGSTLCNGVGADQAVVSRSQTGGTGVANQVSYDVGTSGRAKASVGFATGLGLPEIKLDAYSGASTRIGNNVYAWQTYTYNGADEFDILLSGNFHIVDSSTNATNGALPGGANAAAGFAIWNKADFFSYMPATATAAQINSRAYLFGGSPCSDFEGGPGPRASSLSAISLTGGANQSFSVGQQNCGEQTLTLYKGDEFVIASFAQLTVNRGGWADATGTFTVDLDPSVDAATRQAFASSVTFQTPGAVPEPATWAMMILGFGMVGGTMRRPRKAALAA